MERRLARLAQRQHGAVGRDQLMALGFTRDSITHRLRTGRLHEVHRGVYAAGPQPLNQRGRWYAALLATRPTTALSHLSSTAIRGLSAEGPAVHVTTATASTRKLRGVTVHRARRLDPAELTRIDDLPVTTLERTLLDLAEVLSPHRFESIFEQADRRDLLNMSALRACAARNPGRRGLKPFRSLVDRYFSTPGAEEGIERQFQVLLREERLPMPQVNVLVAGQRVDCYWPEARFVVELDSRDRHSHWAARERDMVRDANLLRIGIVTLRVTSRRMREERSELVADLASQLPRT